MTRFIRVKTIEGEVEVAAEGSGDYAIHRDVGGKKDWTITHVPTGLACRHVSTRAIARAFRKLALRDYLLWMSLDRLVAIGKATMARVQDQATADERIPVMLKAAASGELRIIRCHPLLGPVDLTHIHDRENQTYFDVLGGSRFDYDLNGLGVAAPLSARKKASWVIVSGELGPDARPLHPDWVRTIRDQCQRANVPFYFEGWGEWVVSTHLNGQPDPGHYAWPWAHRNSKGELDGDTTMVIRVGHPQSGRLLDGREWLEMPNTITETLSDGSE